MKLFDKVIEHDWFAENEAVARKYLAEHPEGPVRSLAQIVATMARAQAGHIAEALALVQRPDGRPGRVGAGGVRGELRRHPGHVGDGRRRASRSPARSIEALLKKFGGESPNLAQKVKDELARLDRVGTPAPERRGQRPRRQAVPARRPPGQVRPGRLLGDLVRPCVVELPRLQAAYAKYHAKGFEIVGVSLDETKAAVVDFVKARKLPWKQIHNATARRRPRRGLRRQAIPATFLIDPEGTIVRLDLRGPGARQGPRSPDQMMPSGSPLRASPRRLRDRLLGDGPDGLVAEVLVEELADSPRDFRVPEAAVPAALDLDEQHVHARAFSALANRSDWSNGTVMSLSPWMIRKGGSSFET